MSPEIVTRLDRVSEGSASQSWWGRYQDVIASTGLTSTAVQVIDLDAKYIVDHCVLGAGTPGGGSSTLPDSRLRRGLVVGSVQSGKTASMLGVAAKSLDRGVDVVVLLTGTRVALWRQTVDRILVQLDGWSPEADSARRRSRVMLPPPRLVAGQRGRPGLDNLYHEHPAKVRRGLEKRRPLIAIVMKQTDHLMRFGNYLQETLQFCMTRLNRPLHLLVIDDEADDGSILDAVVESGLDPDSDALKQIPRHVARLWAGTGPHHRTFDELLHATYLAYTATPQANVLQSDHNPLGPRDFVVALRTPLDCGNVEPPRSTTYEEPEGLRRYYAGGDGALPEIGSSMMGSLRRSGHEEEALL